MSLHEISFQPRITSPALQAFVTAQPYITRLHIYDSDLNDEAVHALAGHLPQLRKLSLRGCPNIRDGLIAVALCCPLLYVLDLNDSANISSESLIQDHQPLSQSAAPAPDRLSAHLAPYCHHCHQALPAAVSCRTRWRRMHPLALRLAGSPQCLIQTIQDLLSALTKSGSHQRIYLAVLSRTTSANLEGIELLTRAFHRQVGGQDLLEEHDLAYTPSRRYLSRCLLGYLRVRVRVRVRV